MVGSLAGGARAADRWPDPGGDERAQLALPLADGRYFGANDVYERGRGQRVLGALSQAGANVARRTLSWWHSEPFRDVWAEPSWEAAQRFHDGALARGMTPIHVLGFAPPWARKAGTKGCIVVGRCEFPPRRRMIGEWAEFATEAATRFDGAVFEIWNEPNLRDFWQPEPDPELWAELVVAAYDAIKAVNPAATVLACGCAGVLERRRPEAEIGVAEFLGRAYAPSRPRSPAISMAFPSISFPRPSWSAPDGRTSTVPSASAARRCSRPCSTRFARPRTRTARPRSRSGSPKRVSGPAPRASRDRAQQGRGRRGALAPRPPRLQRRGHRGAARPPRKGHRQAGSQRARHPRGELRPAREGTGSFGRSQASACSPASRARTITPGASDKSGPAVRFIDAPAGEQPPGTLRAEDRGAGRRPDTRVPAPPPPLRALWALSSSSSRSVERGGYTVRARAFDAAGHRGVAARAHWFVR